MAPSPRNMPRIRQSSKRALLNIRDKDIDMPMAPPGMGDDESVPLWWGFTGGGGVLLGLDISYSTVETADKGTLEPRKRMKH